MEPVKDDGRNWNLPEEEVAKLIVIETIKHKLYQKTFSLDIDMNEFLREFRFRSPKERLINSLVRDRENSGYSVARTDENHLVFDWSNPRDTMDPNNETDLSAKEAHAKALSYCTVEEKDLLVRRTVEDSLEDSEGTERFLKKTAISDLSDKTGYSYREIESALRNSFARRGFKTVSSEEGLLPFL